MQISAAQQHDPLEERDLWRAVWQVLSGNALFAAVLFVVALGLVARATLPQMPTLGTEDPIAYSRWVAASRQQFGEFHDVLTALGLNHVMQARWWLLALALALVLALLRLIEALAWTIWVRRSAALLDEVRLAVAHTPMPPEALSLWLRNQGLRVRAHSDHALTATSRWQADVAAALLHGGVALLCGALLVDARWGWIAGERSLIAGAPLRLPDQRTLTLSSADEATYQLTLEPPGETRVLRKGERGTLGGIGVRIARAVEGYRVSAERAGQALNLRASNLAQPSTEVRVVLDEEGQEQFLALPEAQLALALRRENANTRTVQAFAIPSGNVLTTTALAPTLQVNEVRFTFQPAPAISLEAWFFPGLAWAALGAGLSAISALGMWRWSRQRLVVLRRGEWLEIYARGRRVGPLARALAREAEALARATAPQRD